MKICQNPTAFCGHSVDVYYHIAEQRDEKHRSLDEILDSLVSGYMRCILKNKRNYIEVFCVVTSVLPPYHGIHGDLEDKINITFQLNNKLLHSCLEHDIDYLDIHSIYRTEMGFLNPSLGNTHHVNSAYNYPIKKKLIEILIGKNFFNSR